MAVYELFKVNIDKQLKIWAEYHIRMNELSGYSSETVLSKIMQTGGLSSNISGVVVPNDVDFTNPDILGLVRAINLAVDELRYVDEKMYNVLLVYYFGGLRNNKIRGKVFGYSKSWYRNAFNRAVEYLEEIMEKLDCVPFRAYIAHL